MERFISEWTSLDWNLMKFARKEEAVLAGFILGAVFISALLLRYFRQNHPGQKQILIPAVLPVFRKSRWSFVRHIPRALFIAGLPFFFIALADPYVSFVQETLSYPGRRIAVIIDASSSMGGSFETKKLKKKTDGHFYTAVAAAEHFMKLRMEGKYNDLMALIEFGNEPYIITPFTNDYRNILTSITLISEPEEWGRFPDKGTIIIKAIDQAVELFKTFGFLKASGNMMVLISDGVDSQAELYGRSLDSIIGEAIRNKIPIYFIRTYYGVATYTSDELWGKAVEKTGGKFYAAANEEIIFQAIADIDRASTGRIDVARYATKKPLFTPFLMTSGLLWAFAGSLFLLFKIFRVFP